MKPIRIMSGAGQESVWDYPRPPRLESTPKHIWVIFNNITLADTRRAYRMLETSHPPVYYIPPEDIQMQFLLPNNQLTFCEWKGEAAYYSIIVDDRQARNAAWYYPHPDAPYQAIRNYVAFYPQLVDACYVDGELARPQPGGYYGGWITSDIVGPFKGEPGTQGW